ncbi:MAG: [FeFe] hydrogenase H-cluster radical SAM maturase HydE [Gloeocapsa sp. DLM2.Bin57]|jgi:biotin synthase|nr:MAG: [FeFe] hydrogenase H-cluster radical SAM maturase HydE [Gloeocapsa sp. DLM2.Bin57]
MKLVKTEEVYDLKYLTKREIIELLKAQGKLQQDLFKRAREIRLDQVKMRGIIDISTDSEDRNCYYLDHQAIIAIAKQIKAANLDTIVLQSRHNLEWNSLLEEVIPVIKNELNLNIILSLGERNKEVYQKYAKLGVNSFALDFGTSNPILAANVFQTPLRQRLRCLNFLQQLGLKVETGNIVGLPGQTLENIAEDILLTLEIQPSVINCVPFVNDYNSQEEINLVLNTIAIYRLGLKKSLITSANALEQLKLDGKLMGINAGANLLNINFTPAQFGKQYAIHSRQRLVIGLEQAVDTLQRAGLKSA